MKQPMDVDSGAALPDDSHGLSRRLFMARAALATAAVAVAPSLLLGSRSARADGLPPELVRDALNGVLAPPDGSAGNQDPAGTRL